MSIGPPEIVVLFLLALLVFGPHRLPEIGRNLGKVMREMKKMSNEVTSAFEEAMNERPRSTSHEWSDPDYEPPKYPDPEDYDSASSTDTAETELDRDQTSEVVKSTASTEEASSEPEEPNTKDVERTEVS